LSAINLHISSLFFKYIFTFLHRTHVILAVKENQKQLLEEIVDEFNFAKEIAIDTSIDIGNGRI
jgi:hypothetical protein